jgi:hypothetical protein
MTKMLNLIRLTTFTTMLNGRNLQSGDELKIGIIAKPTKGG